MSKYIKGDKVVMEITDRFKNAYGHEYYSVLDSTYSTDFIDEKTEPLSTYTEPLEAKIRRQAAEITRLLAENKRLWATNKHMESESMRVIVENNELRKEMEQAEVEGAEAAWELVRKIFDMETSDIEDIFVTEDAWNLGTVLNNYTYAEAAAKVAEWEKVKEFKVGDILEDRDEGNKVIVTSLKGRVICLLWDDGRIGTTYIELAKGIFRNTGRHIDIDGFLKQIGG